jgi:hypothetical protein
MRLITFPQNPDASCLPVMRADESLADYLSRLIGELLACQDSDRVRAAHIRQLIDAAADELEIHHDLEALAMQGPQCLKA